MCKELFARKVCNFVCFINLQLHSIVEKGNDIVPLGKSKEANEVNHLQIISMELFEINLNLYEYISPPTYNQPPLLIGL